MCMYVFVVLVSILPMVVVAVVVVVVDVVAHERNHYGTNTSPCCRPCHCMSLSSTCYHHHLHHQRNWTTISLMITSQNKLSALNIDKHCRVHHVTVISIGLCGSFSWPFFSFDSWPMYHGQKSSWNGHPSVNYIIGTQIVDIYILAIGFITIPPPPFSWFHDGKLVCRNLGLTRNLGNLGTKWFMDPHEIWIHIVAMKKHHDEILGFFKLV